MNTLKILFLVVMLMGLAITDLAATYSEEELLSSNESDAASSIRGTNRLLSHKHGRIGWTACDKYPKVCHVKGSAGPDCCKNKCVNLSTDRFNCGRCGKKCNYRKICCEGKCVDPSTNKKHCGKCGNKCNPGSSCVYGMCSYA